MITTFYPKDKDLQRYVDFFYIFRSAPQEKWNHIAFPHINTGLSFFNAVLVNRGDHSIAIKGWPAGGPSIEVLGKYTQPIFVSCEGLIDEIAVIFKPLGMNRFMREDLMQVAPLYSQPYYNEQWLNAAHELFQTDDRIGYLERFLRSVLCEDDQFIKMESALSMLHTNAYDYSVAEVAGKLNVNLKTFQRNFTKMMSCSPSDYKRIARFRNALQSKLRSGDIKSLTSITYENNYTDQSYFIREFRKMTHQNPKLFFKEVSMVDGDKIIWEIL